MIELTDVEKTYGDVTALDGLSLSVERGETVGLLGTNGAGKSTLFRLLVGHERPDAGTVRVARLSPDAGPRVRERVGYLPEDAGFHPTLTGREVLAFHAKLRAVPAERRERRVERVLSTVGLTDAADRRVGGYSNGMNRRLGLATTLLTTPEVLLLDEPTAGLDPRGVRDFRAVVERIGARDDVTLVLTSHVLSRVATLCDRVAIVEDGRLRADESVDDLRADAGGLESAFHAATEGAAADDGPLPGGNGGERA